MKTISQLACLLVCSIVLYGCSSDADTTTTNENLLFGKWTQPAEAACPSEPTIFFGSNDTFSWSISETVNCEESDLPVIQVSGTYTVSGEQLAFFVENSSTVNGEDIPFQFNENETFSATIEYLTGRSLQFKIFLGTENASDSNNAVTFLFSRNR